MWYFWCHSVSSEAALSGQKAPYKLLVRAVSQETGLEVPHISFVTSEDFVVGAILLLLCQPCWTHYSQDAHHQSVLLHPSPLQPSNHERQVTYPMLSMRVAFAFHTAFTQQRQTTGVHKHSMRLLGCGVAVTGGHPACSQGSEGRDPM